MTATNIDAPFMLTVSGCRGIVGQSLTPGVIARYAGAFARFLRDESGSDSPVIVLARDEIGRASCRERV